MRELVAAAVALGMASYMGGAFASPRSYDIARPTTAALLLRDAHEARASFREGELSLSYRAQPGLGREATRAAFLGHAHDIFSSVFVASQVRVACLRAISVPQDTDGYDDGARAMEVCMRRETYGAHEWATLPAEHVAFVADRARFRADVARR